MNSTKRLEVNEVYCELCHKIFYEFEDAELDKCPHCKEMLNKGLCSIEKRKEIEIEVNYKTGEVQLPHSLNEDCTKNSKENENE